MSDEKKDRIAELEKQLYAKDYKLEHTDTALSKHETNAPLSWNLKAEEDALREEDLRKSEKIILIKKMTKKILKASVIFFALALLVAVIVWYRGINIISGDNVKVEAFMPLSVPGGDTFESKFIVTNNNKVSLENVTLYLEYGDGFYATEGGATLPRVTKNLGTILPGQTVTEIVNSLLYGEENSEKRVFATIEYKLTGSSAVLKKTTDGGVKILSSPVNLKLEMLKEANSGQEIEITVTLASNNKVPLEKLLAEVSYPAGFVFKNADPAPAYNNNVWSIPKLSNDGQKIIKIKGIVTGQDEEEKFVKVSLGAESAKDERVLGVVYNSVADTFIIKSPFIGMEVLVNGQSSSEYILSPGKGAQVRIAWKNNNPTKIYDAVFEVLIKGEALNRNSVSTSGGGFYRSVDDTIMWSKNGTPELAELEPGAKGTVTFNFSPVKLGVDVDRMIKNPEITLEIHARAKRTSEVNVPEEISSFALQKVKVETDLRLSSRGLYFSGPFKNTGPLPPKVEKETTYTVVWTIRNASNSVSNASVKTILPVYVKWKNVVSPQGENVAYDERNSEIAWSVGRIPAGGTREVAFQVSFLPSVSQAGLYVDLTKESVITATDDFTKTAVGDREVPIRTILTSDPKFVQEQGAVVQ